MGIRDWFRRKEAKAAPAMPEERKPFRVPDGAVSSSRIDPKRVRTVPVFNTPSAPPGVLPSDDKGMAMDSDLAGTNAWANSFAVNGFWTEGITFLGYAYLSELAQRPEYRMISETIATEMTREWIEFTSTASDDKDKEERIKDIEEEFKRLNVAAMFTRATQQDGFFGRGHIYIDTGDTDNPDELQKSIGDGWDQLSKTKLAKKKIKALRTVEAVWCYPTSYNSNDPLKDDWYRPGSWYVQAKIVNSSRLITLIGREVPDLLKPTYSFGGLSLSQMAKPYVDNWLKTRQSVNDIISAFSVFVLQTNLGESLQADGQQLFKRAELFNNLRDNRGLMMIDKDSEAFQNVSAPLGGLSELQSQAQEHMASVSHIPTVKLLGIQPAGLNACLPGDTLIMTDRGEVQIHDVTTDDMVLTREGFAPLTFAGITKYANELIEIKTVNETLLCTGNHPIWMPDEQKFVPAENVRIGDRLLLIGESLAIQKMRRPWHGAVNGGGSGETDITPHGTSKPDAWSFSIGKFGRLIGEYCRRGFTSTTKTAIKPTINLITWSLCLRAITRGFIILNSGFAASAFEIGYASNATDYSKFRSSRVERSIVPRNASLPTSGPRSLRKQNRAPSAYALNAERLSRPVAAMLNFARESAIPLVKIAVTTLMRIISPTQKNIEEPRNRGFVVSVKRMPASEWVYDLTVAPGYLPEFFANGILTHNSSEDQMRVFYDYIHAYQEHLYRAPIRRLMGLVMISLWGEVDPAIDFKFKPLFSLDEKSEAEVEKLKAETDQILIDSGVLAPDESRKRVANDPGSDYSSIDVEDIPDLLDEEEHGLAPKGGHPLPGLGEEDNDDSASNRLFGKAEAA